MKREVFIVIFIMILSLQFVSAELILNQPNSYYNLGDSLDVDVILSYSQDVISSLEIMLSCENGTEIFYNSPVTVSANQQENIKVSLPLISNFIGELLGNCRIDALFNEETTSTQQFELSNSIDVSLRTDISSIDAGDSIIINGETSKNNNDPVQGFFEVGIRDSEIKTKGIVKNNSFTAELVTPFNLRSGNYIIDARAYEEAGGEITNEGIGDISFKIKQKPTKIGIVIDEQEIDPGNYILFRALIYDQADENIDGNVILRIKDPEENIVFEKIIDTDTTENYYLMSNSSYGYWEIEAEALGLVGRRLIYVNELELVNTTVINNTMRIENLGNVPYEKPLEVFIGDESKIINIGLGLGESQEFVLEAPDGTYDIALKDRNSSYDVGTVALTGSAISIKELKEGFKFRYSIFWLFLIVILMTVVVIIFDRMRGGAVSYSIPRVSSNTFKSSVKEGEVRKLRPGEIVKKKPSVMDVDGAEHSLVLKGAKEEAVFLSLKIKKDENISKDLIDSISDKAKEAGAVLYKNGDYVFIFAPTLTHSFKNIAKAASFGQWLKELLEDKIEFGIGLNPGNIVADVEDKKLKFTVLGNSLHLAKKISDSADNEMLLSQQAIRSGSDVKGIKKGEFYVVNKIVSGERNKKFINDFLKRIEKGQDGVKKTEEKYRDSEK